MSDSPARLVIVVLAVLVCFFAGCGVKASPRPPERRASPVAAETTEEVRRVEEPPEEDEEEEDEEEDDEPFEPYSLEQEPF